MKTVLFMLSLLWTTGALAQQSSGIAVLSGEVQSWQMVSHGSHAEAKGLAPEQSLIGFNTPTIARGERPLWELGQVKEEQSLGEAARIQRKQHASDKKAPVIWHN